MDQQDWRGTNPQEQADKLNQVRAAKEQGVETVQLQYGMRIAAVRLKLDALSLKLQTENSIGITLTSHEGKNFSAESAVGDLSTIIFNKFQGQNTIKHLDQYGPRERLETLRTFMEKYAFSYLSGSEQTPLDDKLGVVFELRKIMKDLLKVDISFMIRNFSGVDTRLFVNKSFPVAQDADTRWLLLDRDYQMLKEFGLGDSPLLERAYQAAKKAYVESYSSL